LRDFLPQIAPHLRLGIRWPDGLRALRYPNFRLFFFGQLISLIGGWMQSTAQQWLVYRLTGSQLKLGTVVFAGLIPVLFLSLLFGVLVDRFPRRRLLLLTQSWFMVSSIALTVLTFLGVIKFEYIILISFLTGIGNALDMPARQAFFADLVEREDLLNAIALNSSVFNGARIIGPAIGGVIVAQLGEGYAFGINSITYLAVIGSLFLMSIPVILSPTSEKNTIVELKTGLIYLAGDRRVLGLVIMVASFSILGFPYMVLLPVVAEDILGIGAQGFGGLMAAQGVGALLAALSLAFKGDQVPKGRLLVFSRGILGASLVLLALSKLSVVSMLALAVAGFSLISQLALTNTLIQLHVPDQLRGRVLSSYTWALAGFYPIGSLLIGTIGDYWGTINALFFTAGGCILLTLLGVLIFPQTQKLG
jgi:MFS family permease